MAEELHQETLNENNNAAEELPGVNLTPKAIEKVKQMLVKEGGATGFWLARRRDRWRLLRLSVRFEPGRLEGRRRGQGL